MSCISHPLSRERLGAAVPRWREKGRNGRVLSSVCQGTATSAHCLLSYGPQQRMVFPFSNGWRKLKYYFVTRENYVTFTVQSQKLKLHGTRPRPLVCALFTAASTLEWGSSVAATDAIWPGVSDRMFVSQNPMLKPYPSL